MRGALIAQRWRALAFHQCGPSSVPRLGVICGFSLSLVLVLAPTSFSPGSPVFPSPQKPTFPNSSSIWIIIKHVITSLWLWRLRKHSPCYWHEINYFTFTLVYFSINRATIFVCECSYESCALLNGWDVNGLSMTKAELPLNHLVSWPLSTVPVHSRPSR